MERKDAMKQMRASVFKAKCQSVIRDIQATGEPVLVTKRGYPWVKVVLFESGKDHLFGFMAREMKITGDMESPIWPLKAREVLSK
jgi:antitoxin (DNA-binding transcriptional repressor) of toxin-antitoxin stability system